MQRERYTERERETREGEREDVGGVAARGQWCSGGEEEVFTRWLAEPTRPRWLGLPVVARRREGLILGGCARAEEERAVHCQGSTTRKT